MMTIAGLAIVSAQTTTAAGISVYSLTVRLLIIEQMSPIIIGWQPPPRRVIPNGQPADKGHLKQSESVSPWCLSYCGNPSMAACYVVIQWVIVIIYVVDKVEWSLEYSASIRLGSLCGEDIGRLSLLLQSSVYENIITFLALWVSCRIDNQLVWRYTDWGSCQGLAIRFQSSYDWLARWEQHLRENNLTSLSEALKLMVCISEEVFSMYWD